MQYVLYGIIVIALVILVRNIRIVPQAQAYVITQPRRLQDHMGRRPAPEGPVH